MKNMFLRQTRIARGWSQEDLAERLNVHRTTVNRWEQGMIPERFHQERLSLLFEKDFVQLGFLSDSMSPLLLDPLVPFLSSVSLVGRDLLSQEIKQRLLQDRSEVQVALHGLPGVGKTAIVIALAYDKEIRTHFDGILWAGFGPQPNISGTLGRWSALFHMAASGSGPLKNNEIWAKMLREAIGTRRMLIAMDDVWEINGAYVLKVGGPQCAYLLTIRFPHIAASFATQRAISVSELSEEDGITLLQRLAPEITTYDTDKVHALVRSVGALPLALMLAGRYLHVQAYSGQRRRLHLAMEQLLNAEHRLRLGEPIALIDAHPNLSHETSLSLQSVIAVSDQHLDEQARLALRTLSVFPAKPNTFSEEAALAVSGVFIEILDALSDAGLLEVNGAGRYTLHQAIADYARISLSDEAPSQRLGVYYGTYSEEHRTDVEALDLESQNIGAALEAAYTLKKGEDLVRGVCAFAHFLLLRGLYDQADYHLHHARETAQGDAQMEEAILLPLGQTAQKQGDFPAAVDFFQQGLVLARQFGNAERISAFLADLSWVTWKQGHYFLADEYLSEGLVLARQIGNKERICTCLRVLGGVQASLGNLSQSLLYLEEGLDLARQINNREHICVLLIDLGVTFLEVADFVKGKAFLQEALVLAQEMGHREWVSLVFLNLCDGSNISGQYVEAIEYAQKGLSLARQIGNREWTSSLLINLGKALREQEAFPDAEACFKEGLSLAREINRPHIHFQCLYEYGILRLKQKQVEAAEAMFHEASFFIPEGDHLLAGLWLFAQAQVTAARGTLEQARTLAQESRTLFNGMRSFQTKIVDQWLNVLPDTSTKPCSST